MIETIRSRLKNQPLLYDAARLAYRSLDQLRVRYELYRRRARIADYFRRHRVRKLNIGAGPLGLEGWLNGDLQHARTRNAYIYLDVRKPLPFADGSLDYVFSEHLIEHVSLTDGEFLLAECYRCLRPGGRLRIATPDLRRLVDGYIARDPASQRYAAKIFAHFFLGGTTRTPAAVLNNAMHNWGHQFLYDEETLTLAFAKAGFTDVVRRTVGESDDPELRGIEIHGNSVGADMNEYETMVIEAARPSAARKPDDSQHLVPEQRQERVQADLDA